MSQYRRSPVGGAGRNGDYHQRIYPEEHGSNQYEDYEYGAEEVQMRDIDRPQQHQLAPQPRRPPPRSPMSSRQDSGYSRQDRSGYSRQDGNGYLRPQQPSQVPRVSPNGPFGFQGARGYRSGSGHHENHGYQGQQGPPPPRAARRNYAPSSLDSYYSQESESNPGFSYGFGHQQLRPTPRPPRFPEGNPVPPIRPPVPSPRSIYIGFNPTFPQGTTSPEAPSIPAVPPPARLTQNQQKKPSGSPPQPARRGTSSYYPPLSQVVPPIQEESRSDRRPSYASSSAIPSAWDPEPIEHYPGASDGYSTEGDGEEFRLPAEVGFADDEKGLVRQASIGRKSKPTITDIKGIDKFKSPSFAPRNMSSNESINTASTGGVPIPVVGIGLSLPAEKSSPTLEMPVIDLPAPLEIPSPLESAGPSLFSQPPSTIKKDEYQFSLPNWSMQVAAESPGREESPVTGEPDGLAVKPTRRPPRLNMDAVRDAEARGSLTSLPDLIRRATKLAAVLETGRPESRWGTRGSFLGPPGRTNSDSISDMLASFPPPVLASNKQGKRGTTMSRWPLPADFGNGDDSAGSPPPRAVRRICGLPLWAFILVVLISLLTISAAVIVPLQLVKISKDTKNDDKSSQSLLAECKSKNPCKNGGENVATSSFCGCVCTSGFTGPSCTQMQDSSCTTVNLEDLQEGRVKGVQNVTMGSALPRLFDKAKPSYSITLDTALIMAVFSYQNISCTAQNALVQFNGKSSPSGNIKRFARDSSNPLDGRQLTVDPTTSPTVSSAPKATSTSGSSSTGVTEPDAIDFGRVVVLYLTDAQNFVVVADAQERLQKAFSSGVTSGNLSIGNDISINFTNHTIKLADGTMVGGASGNSTDVSNN